MNINFNYNDIISLENLYKAWREFVRGKKYKKDVAVFSLNLSANIYQLHSDLKNKTYTHGGYQAFNISDPKPRNIHKASVRDRLLHHAIYRILYPYFDRKFIVDSYSCRVDKGTHKALDRFKCFGYKVSKNHTKTLWVLKCDVRKFFASIDQEILLQILTKHILDQDILWLLRQVIGSFQTSASYVIPAQAGIQNSSSQTLDSRLRGNDKQNLNSKKGLPLGNLTSQLLVNIYMNEFDQFVKHQLKVKYYIRYADDFVIFSPDKKYLEDTLLKMQEFLAEKLKLNLHPDKVFIKTLASGVDFLGWVHWPDHRVLRRATKWRMWRNLKDKGCQEETVQSYLGMLKHGNTHKIQVQIRDKAVTLENIGTVC